MLHHKIKVNLYEDINMFKKIVPIVLVLSSVGTSYARPLDKEAGFGGSVAFSVGFSGIESQVATNDGNEVIKDLHGATEKQSTPIAFPLGRLQYTFDDLQTQLYLGNSKDQVATASFQYELGYIHQFSDQTKLTVAYFPRLSMFNDSWEDPFVTGATREKTKETTSGGRIAFERIWGSPFSVKYAYATNEVEDEKSGSTLGGKLGKTEIESLKRHSVFQRAEFEYMLSISKGLFLRPSVKYTRRDADGEANSFDEYHGQVSMLNMLGKHTIITTVSFATKNFDIENPVFAEKQDSNSFSFFSLYTYKQPFDWESVSFNLMAGYRQEASKIDFYDETSYTVATGLAYSF